MSEEQFQKVANKDDLKEGGMLKVEANGKQIVLSMVEGKVYAIDEICTHEQGPLHEGELNGYDLKCPWHAGINADVAAVADAIVKVVDMPFGKRPFRIHIDPAQDGCEVVNAVADHIRAEFLRRIGLDDLLTPRVMNA